MNESSFFRKQFRRWIWVVFGLVCLASFTGGTAQGAPAAMDPAPPVADWRTPGTLSITGCIDKTNKGECGNKPIALTRTVRIDHNIITRMVVPGAKVRFGPFHIHKYISVTAAPGKSTDTPTTFTIRVLGRSPGLYTNGQFMGANPNLVEIGKTTVSIRESEGANGPIDRDVYVTATLPGAFTAVKITASISGPITGSATENDTFPGSCGSLPPTASDPDALDKACLQVAINPLAIVVPRVLPLSIIYEPPGNCSWANLTHQHTAGASISVAEGQSTSTQAVHDTTVFGFNTDHSDFTSTKGSSTTRSTEITVSRSQAFGTVLGAPSNPGDPRCNQPGETPPARPDAGPGKGDVFILALNRPMVYWNTANMSNFFFDQENPTGVTPSLLVATAHQIATGEGLPAGISFTQEEKTAILALNPFTQLDMSAPITLTKRFVFVDRFHIGQGEFIEQTVDRALKTSGGTTLTEETKRRTGQTEGLDAPVKLTMSALAFGGGQAAGAAAGSFLAWAGASWGSTAMQKSFKDIADGLKNISLPTLYDDRTQTTTTVTYGKNTAITNTDSNAVTQSFHIRDTGTGMNVDVYYDTLFGTFAFVPIPAGQ